MVDTGRIDSTLEREVAGGGRSDRRVPGWLRWTAAVVVVVLVALAALWWQQRRFVFLPDASSVPPAAQVIDGARDVTLTTADDLELGAWYVPASDGDPTATVLVANGNAGNRANRAPLAEALSSRGLAVLLFDYRGYGGNPGSPSEEGLALDVRAARSYLLEDLAVAESELIYFGESIGTGVVSGLAADHPPAALVLRSPFTDLPAVAQRQLPFLPVRWLMHDRFPVERDVSDLEIPVTVVLGLEDSLVPPNQSRAVAAAAEADLVEVPGAGHNDRVLLDGDELVDAVVVVAEGATGP